MSYQYTAKQLFDDKLMTQYWKSTQHTKRVEYLDVSSRLEVPSVETSLVQQVIVSDTVLTRPTRRGLLETKFLPLSRSNGKHVT